MGSEPPVGTDRYPYAAPASAGPAVGAAAAGPRGETRMEWSIQQVARSAGITSRTLRHYDHVGLLPPSRVGENGYRYYDQDAIVRLQRILLLRDLGLGLGAIAEVVDRDTSEEEALREHIALLEEERRRIDRKIAAARRTLAALAGGEKVSVDEAFDGFNDAYEDEVVARWGRKAFEDSNRWWHGMTGAEQAAWKRSVEELCADWEAAWRSGETPCSERARAMAVRHVEWLATIPGTPAAEGDRERTADMIRCLGDMYADDPAFARTYGGPGGAEFVRDALHAHARTGLAPDGEEMRGGR